MAVETCFFLSAFACPSDRISAAGGATSHMLGPPGPAGAGVEKGKDNADPDHMSGLRAQIESSRRPRRPHDQVSQVHSGGGHSGRSVGGPQVAGNGADPEANAQTGFATCRAPPT